MVHSYRLYALPSSPSADIYDAFEASSTVDAQSSPPQLPTELELGYPGDIPFSMLQDEYLPEDDASDEHEGVYVVSVYKPAPKSGGWDEAAPEDEEQV